MPALTPQFIADQERATAEHFADMAQKARHAGDPLAAEEYQYVADLANSQAAKAELAMRV